MKVAAMVARLGGLAVRALAALQPGDFREQFGDTVIAETDADIAAAVPSGTFATMVVVTGAIADTGRGVLLERVANSPP